ILLGSDEEPPNVGSSRVIVYGYDGLSMHPVAPPSLNYVPRPEYPSDEAPLEDQPQPDEVSSIALSLGYVADSDLKEDPEEDHADYFADGGDGGGGGALASADSSAVPIVVLLPSAEDTEAFETDESAPIPPSPRSPQIVIPLSQTRLRKARKTIPSPPLPVTSLPSPTVDSPTYAEAPLGYKAARIRMRAALPPLLLPSTFHRTIILEAEMSSQTDILEAVNSTTLC
nr:hypothetical protein [Tanacetum cinerariifolium]